MSQPTSVEISKAAQVITSGGVVAYPTESCYGLGCAPDATQAVAHILQLKGRAQDKGMILVADEFAKFEYYLQAVTPNEAAPAHATWPGPFTWLWPKSAACPDYLSGVFNTLAIRVSAHPVVQMLCQEAGSALVSTSANRQGQISLRSSDAVTTEFGSSIDYVLPGEIGAYNKPSEIRDLLSGKLIRAQ